MIFRSLALGMLLGWFCSASGATDVTGTWILEGGKNGHRFEVEILTATDSAGGYWLVNTEGARLVYEGRYELKNSRLVRVDTNPKEYDGIAFRPEGERWVWAGDRKNGNLKAYAGSFLRRPKPIASGASFNELGQSPLYVAALNNDTQKVLGLLNVGTPVDSLNNDKRQRTPLFAAIEMGYPELAVLFLEKGANVNQQDRDGVTPLMAAGQYAGPYAKMVKLLLDKGADARLKDKKGMTAVQRLEKAQAIPFRDVLVKELESRK